MTCQKFVWTKWLSKMCLPRLELKRKTIDWQDENLEFEFEKKKTLKREILRHEKKKGHKYTNRLIWSFSERAKWFSRKKFTIKSIIYRWFSTAMLDY